ncbi:MAG: hypothetical protein H7Y27_00580, partial [Gemmatimonadaceae bacterium]|nr:hypothetical protein [Chitinophagaceae bacterium]
WNTAVPAFLATGPGYGLVVSAGGVFRNSSGAAAGSTLSISDSVMILNGGRYVHHTERAHAAIVTVLSRATGTESGEFVFDVPGSTGYTVSGSGRIYGSLTLNASAGPKSYLFSGSNAMKVRGGLDIKTGVNASIDFTAEVDIGGLLAVDGSLDLADRTRMVCRGNISGGGVIKEDGGSFPLITMEGDQMQEVNFSGRVRDQVSFSVNNAGGVYLSDSLRLPYKLILRKGRLFTSDMGLLIIDSSCTVESDSLSLDTFVSGPLYLISGASRSYLLAPVGKGITQRWMALRNSSGDLKVEFFKADPRLLSDSLGVGLHHISSIEYWKIVGNGNASIGSAEISFENVNSGGVTSLDDLEGALMRGDNVWRRANKTGSTGSAGASGSVMVDQIIFSDSLWLTLASSDSVHNVLPEKNRGYTRKKPQQKGWIRMYPTVLEGDMISLEINVAKNARYELGIYDLKGLRLHKATISASTGLNKIYLPIPRLIQGIYLLSAANKNNETLIFRFFKK